MGWLKQEEKNKTTYMAFASDIDAFINKTKKLVRCPSCRKELSANGMKSLHGNLYHHFKSVRIGEEPQAQFEGSCQNCKTRLLIFND